MLRRLVPLITALSPTENNVINNPSGAAGVYDTLNGATILAAAQLQATFISRQHLQCELGLCRVRIRQYDSDSLHLAWPLLDFPKLTPTTTALAVTPSRRNRAMFLMGTATGQTALQPAFSFIDLRTFSNVSNGSNPGDNETPPATELLNVLCVFLNAGDPGATFGLGLYLTASVTDIVVIGLNDTGFADDNHDDFIAGRVHPGTRHDADSRSTAAVRQRLGRWLPVPQTAQSSPS